MRGIAQDRFAAGHPPIGNPKGRADLAGFRAVRPRICTGMSFVLTTRNPAKSAPSERFILVENRSRASLHLGFGAWFERKSFSFRSASAGRVAPFQACATPKMDDLRQTPPFFRNWGARRIPALNAEGRACGEPLRRAHPSCSEPKSDTRPKPETRMQRGPEIITGSQ